MAVCWYCCYCRWSRIDELWLVEEESSKNVGLRSVSGLEWDVLMFCSSGSMTTRRSFQMPIHRRIFTICTCMYNSRPASMMMRCLFLEYTVEDSQRSVELIGTGLVQRFANDNSSNIKTSFNH